MRKASDLLIRLEDKPYPMIPMKGKLILIGIDKHNIEPNNYVVFEPSMSVVELIGKPFKFNKEEKCKVRFLHEKEERAIKLSCLGVPYFACGYDPFKKGQGPFKSVIVDYAELWEDLKAKVQKDKKDQTAFKKGCEIKVQIDQDSQAFIKNPFLDNHQISIGE